MVSTRRGGGKASGPGKTSTDGFDAMDDRQRAGSSETAGRNRRPRSYVCQGEYSPMLKPLTLSLSLAVALGFCSVSMAGGHDSGCSTCGLASPQGGPIASAQGPIAHRLRRRRRLRPQEVQPVQRAGRLARRPALQAEGAVPSPGHLRVGPEEEAAVGSPRRRLRRRLRRRRLRLRSMRPARLLPRARVATPLRRARGYAAPSGQGGYAAPQAARPRSMVPASTPTGRRSPPRPSPRSLPR